MLMLALSTGTLAQLAARLSRPFHSRTVRGPRVRLRLICEGDSAALELNARRVLDNARARYTTRALAGGVEVLMPVAARHTQRDLASLPSVIAVQWAELGDA